MKLHLIEGGAGCAYAIQHHCVAVVVDALRASATAAFLLEAGAVELIVVRDVDEAFAMKRQFPDALLAGERNGVPPPGFDLGNSPLEVARATGRRVIFTTTTGAGRLVSCWGAPAIYLGSTVNATAAARAALRHDRDVVLIPAGLMSDPLFDAQEDWAAAAAIASAANRLDPNLQTGAGGAALDHWIQRIDREGLGPLFEAAPHAAKLRAIGLTADIAFCARLDTTAVAPRVIGKHNAGVIVRKC